MSIYAKLNAARTAFHAIQLKKSGRNTFANYDYFELGDFLIPAMKVLSEHDLCAVVSFEKDTATMRVVDVTNPADSIVLTSPMGSAALKGCHEVQNIGAVETYQRRYLWVALMEIVEHDALDATTGKDKDKRTPVIPGRPPTDSLDIDADTERYLQDLAAEVAALAKTDPQAADEQIRLQKLEGDQEIALANMLDSTTRAALRKARQAYMAKLKAEAGFTRA